jgi:type VI secretion system protein ImpA
MDRVILAVFMVEVEQLLKPVSAEEPCGKDLSYDPGFLELEGLVAGKPETQFSAAEEPDWKAVRDASVALLGQSKDLRVAVTLCLALIKLDGAVGLRDGLALLKGMLEHYWPDLYPKLDPGENNDPVERINIVASLSTPLGTFGDPLRFVQRLREMPLANSPQLGWFSLADTTGDKIMLANGQEKPATSAAQIKAAFHDTKPNELESCGQAILDSIVLAKDIDRFLMETVGTAQAPDMAALTSVLNDIQKNLAPYTSKVPGQMQTEGQVSDSSGSGGFAINGTIQSRQDVVRLLDQICEYYARTEPSSPLPLLLRRAQRLAEMDFLQIVDELTPAMRAQLEPIVGVRPGEERPSSPT